MTQHDRAGTRALPADLIDVPGLITAYYSLHPDVSDPSQQVAFGTSGHRGSAFDAAFNDDHIAATSQAIVDHRRSAGIAGPLFMGRDTHGLSEPAWTTALEVFAANDVTVMIDSGDAYTPTPAVSHAILKYNRGRGDDDPTRADGVVVTPSHNPPRDGGFKYNPPDGGPAGAEITSVVQDAANAFIATGMAGVSRVPIATAKAADTTRRYDYMGTYVADLPNVVDLDAIRAAGVRIGADPLGGASVDYWGAIGEAHGLDLTVVNPNVDPTWRFMTLDWDGKIRMDCSSPFAMASLIEQRSSYDVATGNDADSDRHGIVTPDGGLMNPNHFLAVSIQYLYSNREQWSADAAVGKTVVSSSMIDRVASSLGRQLVEVPVGFKWFVPGLVSGSIAFGGEESAGASFLRRNGEVWTTDKDGIILALLASEIIAHTGKTPSQHYQALTEQFGAPVYARVDAPATREEKAVLKNLSPEQVTATELAGEPITATLTEAPGNHAAIGGLKVTSENGWFAARPSGTEDVYKIYAESFLGADHLARIQQEARVVVSDALGKLTRLITVDGPAGSGKTTFAEILAAGFGAASVIHMDDLYEGWRGLDERLTQRLDAWIVTPLRAKLPPRYLRYDWHAERFAEWVTVPASEWLILEGVGAGQAVVRQVAVFGVWVEAPAEVRLTRGLVRDGSELRSRWLAWQALEEEHFAADRTRDHCDAIVIT